MTEDRQRTQPNWRMRFVNGAARTQSTRAEQEEARFIAFIATVVRPAFSEITRRLAERGRTVSVQDTRAACGISVMNGTTEEIGFRITTQTLPSAIVPEIEIRMHERRGLRIVRKTALFRRGPGGVKTLDNTTIEDVVTEFLAGYEDALARLEKG